jgi:hypothetical protein
MKDMFRKSDAGFENNAKININDVVCKMFGGLL